MTEFEKITCVLCKDKFLRITNTHLINVHQITMKEYHEQFPLEPMNSPQLLLSRADKVRGRTFKRTKKVNQTVPTKCGICNEVFPSRSEMCKHKSTIHQINPSTLTIKQERICSFCTQTFLTKSKLASHQLRQHRDVFFKDKKSGPPLGTKFTLEHKLNLSKSIRIFHGTYDPSMPFADSPITNPEMDYRWCNEYAEWMTSVKRRDKYICQHCGKDKKAYLVSHHIKPYREFIKDRYDVNNGITLCMSCHMIEESKLKKERAACGYFIYQLLLLGNSSNFSKLNNAGWNVYSSLIIKNFTRSVQKVHHELSNDGCSKILVSIRIDA